MSEPLRTALDPLLSRQSHAWAKGNRPTVEELLTGSPVANDPDAVLDLIYNEILLREAQGEAPDLAEYIERYPNLRTELELQFVVHRAVEGDGLEDTPRMEAGETIPDEATPAKERPLQLEYEMLELLGRGGMGVVYKARHRTLRRMVALKTFEPTRNPTERERLRFRAEAEAVARFDHPNIIRIYEVDEWEGKPYLALELADGGTLGQRLQLYTYAPRDAAVLIETLARAVAHAHKHGVIHRDLKPANVLFASDGTPKITDFGLAKLQDTESSARDTTRTGDPLGTPRYMSPEQAAGQRDMGPAADVHALGTLLYECITGRVPFLAAGVVETLDLIRNADPPPLRRFQPSVPRDLETICLHALKKQPADRYPSAEAMADDLRRFLDRKPIEARPTPLWEKGWKWCRRRPGRAALVALGLILLASAGVAAIVFDRMEQARIADLRDEVDHLVREGQAALAREEDEVAETRFRDAWVRVQGEPALRDYQTGVSGWLDHARRAVMKQRWKQRVPPRDFENHRDEAIILSLLLEKGARTDQAKLAREAIAAALQLAPPNDPAWRKEREFLALMNADLAAVAEGPAAALVLLDQLGSTSRAALDRRAVYLIQAGQAEQGKATHLKAQESPPDPSTETLLKAADGMRRRDFSAAATSLDALLEAEPEHFTARLLRAICAIHLGQPGEARAGLVACAAQRPMFGWGHVYRGRAASALGDRSAAARAFDQAAGLQPGLPRE